MAQSETGQYDARFPPSPNQMRRRIIIKSKIVKKARRGGLDAAASSLSSAGSLESVQPARLSKVWSSLIWSGASLPEEAAPAASRGRSELAAILPDEEDETITNFVRDGASTPEELPDEDGTSFEVDAQPEPVLFSQPLDTIIESGRECSNTTRQSACVVTKRGNRVSSLAWLRRRRRVHEEEHACPARRSTFDRVILTACNSFSFSSAEVKEPATIEPEAPPPALAAGGSSNTSGGSTPFSSPFLNSCMGRSSDSNVGELHRADSSELELEPKPWKKSKWTHVELERIVTMLSTRKASQSPRCHLRV